MNWFHIFFRKVCSCCTSVYCHIKRYVKNPIWCNLFTLNASLQGCIYTWILSLNTHNLKSKPNSFVKMWNIQCYQQKYFFHQCKKATKTKKSAIAQMNLSGQHILHFLFVSNKCELCLKFVHLLITPMIFHLMISDELSLILRGKYYNYQRKESNLEFSHTIVMHFFVT